MTSPTVDENPEPGEEGYYSWHKAVAKHHNDKSGVGAHHAASRVSVDPSSLTDVSSSDVQGALSDLDAKDYGRGDGSLTAGDVAVVSSLSPLTLKRVASPSDGDALVFNSTSGEWEADSGTYRKDDRPAVLGSNDLRAVDGSPSIVQVASRYDAWAFVDSTGEHVAGKIDVPASWSTYDVDIWHTKSSSNDGDVQLFRRLYAPSDGDSLATEDVSGAVTLTAVTTADTLGITTVLSGQAVVAGVNFVQIARLGANSNDTLTGDWMLLAVVLRKAS